MRLLRTNAAFFMVLVLLQACLYEKNEAIPAESSGNNSGTNESTNGTNTGTNTGTGTSTGTGTGTSTGGSTTINCTSTSSGTVTNPTGICFNTQILPFFQSNCASSGCHDAKTRAKGYDLTTYAGIVKSGISTSNPTSSKLYKVMIDTSKDRMPPAPAAKLSAAQTNLVLTWIKEGAKQTNCNAVVNTDSPTFSGVIKPFIDVNCIGCHQAGNASGGVILDNYNNVKTLALNGTFAGTISYATGYRPMPPSNKVSDCQIVAVQNWIKNGAKND